MIMKPLPLLLILLVISCHSNSKQETELLQKENRLLQKEIELIETHKIYLTNVSKQDYTYIWTAKKT